MAGRGGLCQTISFLPSNGFLTGFCAFQGYSGLFPDRTNAHCPRSFWAGIKKPRKFIRGGRIVTEPLFLCSCFLQHFWRNTQAVNIRCSGHTSKTQLYAEAFQAHHHTRPLLDYLSDKRSSCLRIPLECKRNIFHAHTAFSFLNIAFAMYQYPRGRYKRKVLPSSDVLLLAQTKSKP